VSDESVASDPALTIERTARAICSAVMTTGSIFGWLPE
jgi:hypothetical protein